MLELAILSVLCSCFYGAEKQAKVAEAALAKL